MNTTGIDLYSWATPNGWKASCTLEELGIPYTLYPVDITKGQQQAPEYLALKGGRTCQGSGSGSGGDRRATNDRRRGGR